MALLDVALRRVRPSQLATSSRTRFPLMRAALYPNCKRTETCLASTASRSDSRVRRVAKSSGGRSKETDSVDVAQKLPIAAKLKSRVQALKSHENIYTLPNILTATRLVVAPAVGYLVLSGHLKYALGLFAYAGVTDLVDGWIARKYKLQTVVGSVIDPMADKLLMTVLTVTLGVEGLMPAYLAVLILGRDVSLATAAIYYRYASLPAPKTMSRYWDFSLPSAEVHPTTISKANTFLQLVLVGSTLALPVFAAEVDTASWKNLDTILEYYQYLVAGTTIWSGASYAFLKNVVDILGPDEALKARQGKIGRAIIGVTFGGVLITAAWLYVKSDVKDQKKVSEAA